MTVNWLLDAEMFDAYRDELVACICRHGNVAKLIRAPSPPYRWDDAGNPYRSVFPVDACVVCHGDIELVTRVRRDTGWTPGAFATVEHYACSSYYCHFGGVLLNRNYIMLPFGELRRQRDFLLAAVGQGGRIFVRPDSPLKLFTGQVASEETFEADVEFMGFYEFPPESLVVVSAPQSIAAEWRFVVANRSIITGCQYSRDGKQNLQPGYEQEAHALAARIASSEYQPDAVWVMDICLISNGSYHLMEIGGFSFADLYACDKDAIVAAVSEAARIEWERARSASQ